MQRIAIFGKNDCKQARAACEAVKREGGQPELLPIQLDTARAPELILGNRKASWDGVDFSGIKAAYVRGMAPNTLPALPPMMNETMLAEWRTRYFREQQYQACAYSFFEFLRASGKLVINPFSAYLHHNAKAQFYELLRARGFCFPKTLTTNDPAAVRAFRDEVGKVVLKPGIGVGSTRLLVEEDLSRLQELGKCPVTMQEYIKGKTIRVHVVADKVVVALRILSEAVDSRTGTKGFEFYKMQESEQRKIVAANQAQGLHFAAWDVIAAEDGRYVYLDCNPGAYIMWIGEEFVRAVMTQMARYLLAFAETGSIEKAAARVEQYRQ
jgi:hypothetical protein